MNISVVVITRNRHELLIQVLSSLVAQTVAPFEVVIVDGSDAPYKVPKELDAKLPIRLFRDRKKLIPHARNIGIQKSSGDIIFFVDDDCTLHTEAIGRVVACGAMVRHFKVGDLVTRIMNRLPEGSGYHLQWGAFAERGIVTDWQAMRDDGIDTSEWTKYTAQRVLPNTIDPIGACMIITWRETHSFFKQIDLARDSRLLIIGSGTQALAFTEHARNSGIATVVVGSPNF